MTVDVVPQGALTVADLPEWSVAEFLDTPLAGGLVLRALVCRLGARRWQWSVCSLDGDESGALICAGLERTSAAARDTAAAELLKCLGDSVE
jgi:hypothetical protein